MDPVSQLRKAIADPKNGHELFTDPELEDFISNHSDINSAAAELWGYKAANVADWYQVNIDGSFMSREQVFEHCIRMRQHFLALGGSTSDPVFASSVGSTTESAEF